MEDNISEGSTQLRIGTGLPSRMRWPLLCSLSQHKLKQSAALNLLFVNNLFIAFLFDCQQLLRSNICALLAKCNYLFTLILETLYLTTLNSKKFSFTYLLFLLIANQSSLAKPNHHELSSFIEHNSTIPTTTIVSVFNEHFLPKLLTGAEGNGDEGIAHEEDNGRLLSSNLEVELDIPPSVLEAAEIIVNSTSSEPNTENLMPVAVLSNISNSQTFEIPGFFQNKIFEETGYGHHNKRSPKTKIKESNYFSETRTAPLTLAEIPIVSPTAEFTFHANESLSYVRTDNWLLNYNVCLEARFRLEGKRTRLLVYTCQMEEGGECTLDKFSAVDIKNQNFTNAVIHDAPSNFGSLQVERCVRLRPWMFLPSPFAFHFKFVRRPRRFNDMEAELRHRRRRHGRRATREVGRVTLKGFKDCSKTCVRDENTGEWSDAGSSPESNYITVNYQYEGKKRRRRRLHIRHFNLNNA